MSRAYKSVGFISYSHKDKDYFKSIKEGIEEQINLIQDIEWNIWDDEQIGVGEEWHVAIQSAVDKCQFAILLISPSFFGSDYIKEEELNKFLNSYEESNSKFVIFPILLRSCRFEKIKKLSKFQHFIPSGEDFGFPEEKHLPYSFLKDDPTKKSYLDKYHMLLVDSLEQSINKIILTPNNTDLKRNF